MLRVSLPLALLLCLAGISFPVWAHSMYQTAILLDFHGTSTDAELQLPVERLQTALGIQLSPQSLEMERVRISEYLALHFSASLADGRKFQIDPIDSLHWSRIDGAPYVVARFRLAPPIDSGADLFDLHCDALLDRIPSQATLVSIRSDWRTSTFADDPQLLGVLRDSERNVRVDRRNGSWWNGFGGVFKLGMRHIAEGTDHLLFLLVLLLPAPLLVLHAQWAGPSDVWRCLVQIGKVVTAFTAGHSITLAAGAMNLVRVPSRPIETFIAISILVSAVHALRPIFPGRETFIAGGFGLVHGLAFASTLASLGLGRWERVASIFGFNLGIEAMQLVVVTAALPSLILLSRTRLYPPVRVTGALFAAVAASGWIAQRLWDVPNPVDAFVTGLAKRAVWVALGLTLLGIGARSLVALRQPPKSYAAPNNS
jgi:HupE / UreJ protein